MSLQFALSKQHNVVITLANPHMQPVSSQSSIKHMWSTRSHRFSPGFLKQRDDRAAVWERIRTLQCFTQIISGQNEHSLLLFFPPSFLPLLPHFLLFTRALPSCTDLLIISIHTQTQSCLRVSSYQQANVDTNIKSTAKPRHYSNSLSQPPRASRTHTSSSLSLSLSRALFPSFNSWASSVKQPLQHFTMVNVVWESWHRCFMVSKKTFSSTTVYKFLFC